MRVRWAPTSMETVPTGHMAAYGALGLRIAHSPTPLRRGSALCSPTFHRQSVGAYRTTSIATREDGMLSSRSAGRGRRDSTPCSSRDRSLGGLPSCRSLRRAGPRAPWVSGLGRWSGGGIMGWSSRVPLTLTRKYRAGLGTRLWGGNACPWLRASISSGHCGRIC